MIPARKSTPPPRKKPVDQLQVNRLFDNEEEMTDYLNKNFPDGYDIIETWKVTQIACRIELKK